MKLVTKFLSLQILLLLSVCGLSAQSKDYLELSLPEVKIVNEEFKKLIVRSTGYFMQNYNTSPGVIIVSMHGVKGSQQIQIENRAYLHTDKDEEKEWSTIRKFKYATMLNNILVLFEVNINNKANFFEKTGLVHTYKSDYGNLMICCYQSFKYDGEFSLINQYCCSDLYID